jgi:hypothetical protein
MTKNLSLKERHIFNIVESDDQRVSYENVESPLTNQQTNFA